MVGKTHGHGRGFGDQSLEFSVESILGHELQLSWMLAVEAYSSYAPNVVQCLSRRSKD